MTLTYSYINQEEALEYLDELVQLRAGFFSEYPYLQNPNDIEFQTDIVTQFLTLPGVVLLVAKHQERIVAAVVSVPLTSMELTGLDISVFRKFFYQTKTKPEDFVQGIWTLSLPEYRRRGVTLKLGNMLDEKFTIEGYKGRLMANLVRPTFDPKAPEGFSPSSEFFLKKRGYVRIPVKPSFSTWTDLGDKFPSEKAFEYYVRWLSKSD